MFRAAQIVGEAMHAMQERYRKTIETHGASADASILVAGEFKGGEPRLFLIYGAGNFIEATSDTPYFQIGEHKYGKPILDRIITPESSIDVCVKAVRSEEHTSELQSLMRISYAVFCLTKKKYT